MGVPLLVRPVEDGSSWSVLLGCVELLLLLLLYMGLFGRDD
jgi:hypothetical protein